MSNLITSISFDNLTFYLVDLGPHPPPPCQRAWGHRGRSWRARQSQGRGQSQDRRRHHHDRSCRQAEVSQSQESQIQRKSSPNLISATPQSETAQTQIHQLQPSPPLQPLVFLQIRSNLPLQTQPQAARRIALPGPRRLPRGRRPASRTRSRLHSRGRSADHHGLHHQGEERQPG